MLTETGAVVLPTAFNLYISFQHVASLNYDLVSIKIRVTSSVITSLVTPLYPTHGNRYTRISSTMMSVESTTSGLDHRSLMFIHEARI